MIAALRRGALALALALALPGLAAAQSSTAAPTEYQGATALGLTLRQLGTVKRVLMIAAHPDDESTAILSTLALGQGAQVAYLSLTRGEGGQNGIGPELQEGLGLLRTEELLAARRLDGARQFFTRAYDYGYSRSAEEALSRWPREEIVGDAVATIRAFRPDVVLSIFTGTPADGHGAHQMAGIAAHEAFAAAGDPARFPEQTGLGPGPHTPLKLYRALWRGGAEGAYALETGTLDPLLGRSWFQVAMASRGRHRSQDMGRLEEPGPRTSPLQLVAHAPGHGDLRLFAGVDTLLSQRARAAGPEAAAAAPLLLNYEAALGAVREAFNPLRPGAELPSLLAARRVLLAADAAAGPGAPAWFRADLGEERERLSAAIALANGVVMDAFSEVETVAPGETLELFLRLWNGGTHPVAVRSLEPLAPGWRVQALDAAPDRVRPGEMELRRFRLTAPAILRPSEPYFLRLPRVGDLYRWPEDAASHWGEPFEPPLLVAAAELELEGAPLRLEREVTHRGLDLRSGEFRRPLRAVAPISLLLDPGFVVLPTGNGTAPRPRLTARVRNDARAPAEGRLRLSLPPGWAADPADLPLRLGPGEERAVTLTLTPPAGLSSGSHAVSAVFRAHRRDFDRGYTLIDYPHVDPRPLYRPAATRVTAVDVALPRALHVGYVTGAGDDVALALAQMGVRVTDLGPQELADGDLSVYDAVVTGIRAYEVRPDLVAHNARLLDYARAGGTVVVQYNKYEYLEPGIAPFPVSIARPHDRITDPAAPVTLLAPEHRALRWPNRIGAADFDGWVHERGLYHLREWDARFTPLLEMADPGEAPQRGSLLVAPLGAGHYVYTGLAFFRQVPEGVPGAYRLLANLISLGVRE
jgi:LmbE family N-acetylglucosaminyl deacetylase